MWGGSVGEGWVGGRADGSHREVPAGGKLYEMKRSAVALAVGLTLVLVSCGKSGDGSGTTTSTTSTAPVAPTTSSVAPTTTTVVIGGTDFVIVPDESGGVPLDLEVGCPNGPTFPVSALLDIEPLVGSGRQHIEDAIAGFLGSEEGARWPQVDEWHVLYETDVEVILVYIDAPRVGFQTVLLVDGEWRWFGSQIGEGGCPLEARLPEGLSRVTWRIDPEFGLDPASTTVHLLATEQPCASGQAMGDRLRAPHVVITNSEVRITLAADALEGGQFCPGNPEQSVAIDLGIPLGDRAVVDGLAVLGDLVDLIGSTE